MAKKNIKEKEKTGIEIGRVGDDIFDGFLDVDHNRKFNDIDNLVKTVDEMRGSDASIEAILEAQKAPIISAKFFIEPVDESDEEVAIAEFCNDALYGIEGGFKNFLRELLTGYDYGFSVFEKVFTHKDGNVTWKRFSPRIQKSIDRWEIQGKPWRNGHPAGITQQINNTDDAEDTFRDIPIPWEKLIIFTNKKRGNNFQGRSVLRAAYLHWRMKNVLYKVSSISAERFGVGIPFIKHKTGAKQKAIDEYKKLVRSIKSNEQSFAVFDTNVEEFGIMTPAGGGSEKGMMNDLIMHHDRKIYDAILAGFLNLTNGEGGSNALSKDQSSFFLRGLQGSADSIGTLMQPHIDELVEINFGVRNKYPKLMTSDIGQISMDEYINSLKAAKEIGLLNWLPKDEDKIREQLKLPPIDPEERKKIEDEKVKSEAEPEAKPEVPEEVKDPEVPEEKEKKEQSEKYARLMTTERERAYMRNIGDFENSMESEYNNIEGIIANAENALRPRLAKVYELSESELIDGVKVLAFSKNNREMQKKAIAMIDATAQHLDEQLINSKIQDRIFAKAEAGAIKNLKDNMRLLQESIEVNQSQFNSFISGYKSNVKGVLFNEPRRMREDVVLNYGSQVSVDLAVKQAGEITFNRNVLKLSTVTHARGAYQAIQYGNNVTQGFTMYKTVVPRQKLKKLNPSGATANMLYLILTAAEINRRASKETDGKTTEAVSGLNIHHGATLYYYPIASENLEEERELARQQRAEFQEKIEE